jgi:hypothetical protein
MPRFLHRKHPALSSFFFLGAPCPSFSLSIAAISLHSGIASDAEEEGTATGASTA